jgi:hypothetical protein
VNQGDCFFVESHIVETSRSLIASLRERWMIEVDEEIYKNSQIKKEEKAPVAKPVEGVALPKATSETLESRQAANNKLDRLAKKKAGGAETEDVATPDLVKAQEKISKAIDEKMASKKLVLPKMTKDEPETVKALSNEDNFESVVTPNFDEKHETNDLKDAIEAELEQKVTKRRRRKSAMEAVIQ